MGGWATSSTSFLLLIVTKVYPLDKKLTIKEDLLMGGWVLYSFTSPSEIYNALMNPHQAITPLEDVPLQDFFLSDNTLPMLKVYPNS
jgi:hypothetical protein